MIVQCPSCSKRYRVNDANIPPSGGKIRCPECSHAFVVYPEPDPVSHEAPGEKTSVAQAPNMQELLSHMKQNGADASAPEPGGDQEEEVAKTEVMSGAELPDFSNLFGGGGSPDQTEEMKNPLTSLGSDNASGGEPGFEEDDLSTQELNSDVIQKSMDHVRNKAEAAPPIGGGGDHDSTQIAPPQTLGTPPEDPQQGQRRVSAPSGPTPPPRSANAGGQPAGRPSHSGPGSSPGTPSTNFGTAATSGSSASGPISQQPPQPEAADDAPDQSHDGPWKLQTNFGLTYEFADNESLKNWLESRDELDGYKLSADGENFLPLSEFPQVDGGGARSGANSQVASGGNRAPVPGNPSPSPRAGSRPGQSNARPQSNAGSQRSSSSAGGAGSTGGSGPLPRSTSSVGSGRSPFMTAANPAVGGSGPQDTTKDPDKKEKINPNEMYKPPSRDSPLLNVVLWGAFGLLVAAAIALALQLFGVIDVLGEDEEVEEASPVVQQDEGEQDLVDEPEQDSDSSARNVEEVDRILDGAREDIDSNRLSSAFERLEQAEGLDPERIQLYEMKAEVHEKLGEVDEAEAMLERAEELRLHGEDVEPPSEDEESG